MIGSKCGQQLERQWLQWMTMGVDIQWWQWMAKLRLMVLAMDNSELVVR
jgi:hypothetical protein